MLRRKMMKKARMSLDVKLLLIWGLSLFLRALLVGRGPLWIACCGFPFIVCSCCIQRCNLERIEWRIQLWSLIEMITLRLRDGIILVRWSVMMILRGTTNYKSKQKQFPTEPRDERTDAGNKTQLQQILRLCPKCNSRSFATEKSYAKVEENWQDRKNVTAFFCH